MDNAAEEVKSMYEPEDNGVYNIAVSGDRTWRKRWYISSCLVVSILSFNPGKIIDNEVMSKECFSCKYNQRIKSHEEFAE